MYYTCVTHYARNEYQQKKLTACTEHSMANFFALCRSSVSASVRCLRGGAAVCSTSDTHFLYSGRIVVAVKTAHHSYRTCTFKVFGGQDSHVPYYCIDE